ncbi:catechol 2,3-dioxygenase [Virgisporangium aurantiacum]
MSTAPSPQLTHDPERRRDLAHVGPVEVYTPALEDSVDFFVRLMGLREVNRDATSVYLHTWDDYQAWTVRLIRRDAAGVGRTYLRAASRQAMQRVATGIESTGHGHGTVSNVPHLGRVYLFTDPDGHEYGLYWDSAWYRADATDRPASKNQAAAYPGRGPNLRRLDHVNYRAADMPAVSMFLRDTLGARCTEQVVTDDGSPQAMWFSVGNKSYDLVYTGDRTAGLHHLAFATDTREEILRAADLCLDAGIRIETGPNEHAIQQTFYLYVSEPGGNRIELCNAGARLILAPDWPTVTWTREERARGTM